MLLALELKVPSNQRPVLSRMISAICPLRFQKRLDPISHLVCKKLQRLFLSTWKYVTFFSKFLYNIKLQFYNKYLKATIRKILN